MGGWTTPRNEVISLADTKLFINRLPIRLVDNGDGTYAITTTTNGQITIATLPELPEGNNNIGNVDIVTMPSIPAGTNNIGDVDILTLPELPSGDNNIGNVDIVTLPSAQLEGVTNGIRSIMTDHEQIHLGNGYVLSHFGSVASSGELLIQLDVPANDYVHLKKWSLWTDSPIAKLEIVEAPTLTDGTTAINIVNKRRVGTPDASLCSAFSDPTAISGGTILETTYVGGGGTGGFKSGGTNSVEDEYVLNPSTTYLFRVTNLDSSARTCAIHMLWYEESGG
jgi:hypothetical protein